MKKLILEFLSHVAGTSKGIIVPEELYRSIVTALGTGGVIGLALTILQSVLANAAVIFPNPMVTGVATLALTLIIDLLRRFNQGTPAHLTASAPTPEAPVGSPSTPAPGN